MADVSGHGLPAALRPDAGFHSTGRPASLARVPIRDSWEKRRPVAADLLALVRELA